MTRNPKVLLIAVALVVFSVGCTLISVLSGPRTLSAGDTATYVLALVGVTVVGGIHMVRARAGLSRACRAGLYGPVGAAAMKFAVSGGVQ